MKEEQKYEQREKESSRNLLILVVPALMLGKRSMVWRSFISADPFETDRENQRPSLWIREGNSWLHCQTKMDLMLEEKALIGWKADRKWGVLCSCRYSPRCAASWFQKCLDVFLLPSLWIREEA